MPLRERQERFGRFIEAVEAGYTKGEACRAAGIAWGSLARWITDDSNTCEGVDGVTATFATRYASARITSADFYADRAQVAVEQALTKDDAPVARIRAEVYRWRAAMADPKGYGERRGDLTINVGVGALHLDALRRVTASAKVSDDKRLALPTSPDDTPDDIPYTVPVREEHTP